VKELFSKAPQLFGWAPGELLFRNHFEHLQRDSAKPLEVLPRTATSVFEFITASCQPQAELTPYYNTFDYQRIAF